MSTAIETIDQTGVQALIRERLDKPELYADTPLVIWQAALDDGVMDDLLYKLFYDYNRGKTREEKRTFWYPTTEENSFPDKKQCFGLYALTVSNPDEIPGLPADIPVVIFIDCVYGTHKVPAEINNADQYLFAPDFEQWAAHNSLPEFMKEFIRQGGDHEGIMYRWYNRYNTPTEGCDCPEEWFDARRRLIPPSAQRKWEGRLCDIDEDPFRQAFSCMSADLVDAFRNYVIENGY